MPLTVSLAILKLTTPSDLNNGTEQITFPTANFKAQISTLPIPNKKLLGMLTSSFQHLGSESPQ